MVGNRSPGSAPAPAQGTDRLPAPSAPSPTIYQKDLTTKEELCGKVGGGGFKVSQVPRRKGVCPLTPSTFYEFLEVTLELAPDVTEVQRIRPAARE